MHVLLDPVAFSIGTIKVHWYGIILGMGALVGLILAVLEGKRFDIAPDFFMDLLLIGVPSAIIAARIYYVVFTWYDYKDDPLEVFAIWHGGIAIHGALIGAVLAALWYTRRKGYPFWRIADICAPSLIAGQAIGRWGNFMNQEAHGGPVDPVFLRHHLHIPDFIVNYMNIEGTTYHPTFLYESAWDLAGLILLLVLRRQSFMRAGELFMSYLIWYSIGRFYVEGLRTDSLAFSGPHWVAALLNGIWHPVSLIFGDAGSIPEGANVRMAQLISMLIIAGCVFLMIVRRTSDLAKPNYQDPIKPYIGLRKEEEDD